MRHPARAAVPNHFPSPCTPRPWYLHVATAFTFPTMPRAPLCGPHRVRQKIAITPLLFSGCRRAPPCTCRRPKPLSVPLHPPTLVPTRSYGFYLSNDAPCTPLRSSSCPSKNRHHPHTDFLGVIVCHTPRTYHRPSPLSLPLHPSTLVPTRSYVH